MEPRDFLEEFRDKLQAEREARRTGMHQPVDVLESGRPHRDTVIGHDDQVNLTIALNTSNDVSEFLKNI